MNRALRYTHGVMDTFFFSTWASARSGKSSQNILQGVQKVCCYLCGGMGYGCDRESCVESYVMIRMGSQLLSIMRHEAWGVRHEARGISYELWAMIHVSQFGYTSRHSAQVYIQITQFFYWYMCIGYTSYVYLTPHTTMSIKPSSTMCIKHIQMEGLTHRYALTYRLGHH
jgi:hypothetical protein